jgi:hypothetical protein
MNWLMRDLLRDLIGLITMIWVFLLISSMVYASYNSYLAWTQFTREQKWPLGRFKRVFAQIAFQSSPQKTMELFFSPYLSDETKLHRKRMWYGYICFLTLIASGAGFVLLWRLFNAPST